jgi:hypothetical protein
MNIDIGACFSFGIERFKQNMTFYIVGTLIVAGISFGINMAAQALSMVWGFAVGIIMRILQIDGDIAGVVAGILGGLGGMAIGMAFGLLTIPFFIGFFRGIKKEYEGGKAEIGDIFSAFNIFIPSIINYAVANLVVFLGFLCCIIPGILLSPIMGLTIFYLAKGETEGLSAFKKALATLKSAPILILWNLVLSLFAVCGVIACFVGLFATAPIAAAAMYMLFEQATQTETKKQR